MDEFVIGITEKNRNPYWDMVNAGWADAAQELGVRLRIEAPENEDAVAQAALMRRQLAEGASALAFVGTDPAVLGPVVAEARLAGIPVAAFDLDAPDSGRLFFVGMERPVDAGRRAGYLMIERVPEKSTVIVQTGSDRAPGAVGKKEGFIEVARLGGLTVVETSNDHEDAAQARSIAESALAAHPGAKGIFGVYGYHPIAQAQALNNVGRDDVTVVGFDMLPETVDLIATGRVACSIWIQEYQFGFQTAVELARVLREGPRGALSAMGMSALNLPSNVRTPDPITYTKENIQEFIDWSRAHSITTRTAATTL
jgi:ABC-type sugar transport system substrate-binding protein